jgi:hypothetical protein
MRTRIGCRRVAAAAACCPPRPSPPAAPRHTPTPQAGGQLDIPAGASLDTLTPDLALRLLSAPGAAAPAAAAARATAGAAVQRLQALEGHLHAGCSLALASAAAASGQLPDKLGPVLSGLMQSLRREPAAALQRVGAAALAELLLACVPRSPCPNEKLIRNLALMACGDAAETPKASDPSWCAAAGGWGEKAWLRPAATCWHGPRRALAPT